MFHTWNIISNQNAGAKNWTKHFREHSDETASQNRRKKTKTKNFREFLLHQVLEWTRQQRPLHRSSVLAVSIPLFFMVAHPALGGYLEPNNVYRKSAKVNGKKDNPQHGKVEEQINEVYDTYT